MSELKIALIAIGAVIVLGVFVINWWQEKRFRRQLEHDFSSPQQDALLGNDEPRQPASELLNVSITNLERVKASHDDFKSEPKFSEPQFDATKIALSADEGLDPAPHHGVPENFSIDTTLDLTLPAAQPIEKHVHEDAATQSVFSQNQSDEKPLDAPLQSESAPESALDPTPESVNAGDEDAHVDDDLAERLPKMLHAQIDLTALLYLSEEVRLSAIRQALAGSFHEIGKPVLVHIMDENKEWHLFKELAENQDKRVTKVACSLQLADRSGAVDRNILGRFQMAVEALGLAVSAHVDWQNAGDALSAAISLDLFCLEVDKTIGFHLIHGESGAFTGTKLRGLAEAQGLTLSPDGTFKYFEQAPEELTSTQQGAPAGQLKPSFLMFNREAHPFSPEMMRSSVVKGVTFQIDIPHVKHSAETFNHMIKVARQMEIGLNAVLVDGKNKVLSDIQIERIRQQLRVLQTTMLTRGIVPGSESARRLFS